MYYLEAGHLEFYKANFDHFRVVQCSSQLSKPLQDKYQLNSKLTDHLKHYSLSRRCPEAFLHFLYWLTIASSVFCI